MKIPISHATVEKLISILEDCYNDEIYIDSGLWSEFNPISITHDLIDGDHHRDGAIIEITDDTANWLEVITTDSTDDDMKLIAKSLLLNFSITVQHS